MAGNTRGKIKEHLEGCHRNFDWIRFHIETALILIKQHNPKLTQGLTAAGKAVDVLDETIQGVYGKI